MRRQTQWRSHLPRTQLCTLLPELDTTSQQKKVARLARKSCAKITSTTAQPQKGGCHDRQTLTHSKCNRPDLLGIRVSLLCAQLSSLGGSSSLLQPSSQDRSLRKSWRFGSPFSRPPRRLRTSQNPSLLVSRKKTRSSLTHHALNSSAEDHQ